ncbi:MAG: hypothetical protein AAF998_10345 [Bacteroidota bacterium]
MPRPAISSFDQKITSIKSQMNFTKPISKRLLATLLLLAGIQVNVHATGPEGQLANSKVNLEKVGLAGANVLAFGPNNVLFIGDSKNGIVHAVETKAVELKDPVPYNLLGIDAKIAEQLGVEPRQLAFNDMKIHPVSQEAYIAVRNGHQPEAKSMIAIISPMGGKIRFLDLSDTKHTQVSIKNKVDPEYYFWNEIPASTLNITDIDYHNGQIYVAGLTNGEFASNLRIIPYPFNQKQSSVKGIEIWHAVHTQMETRAPIRTMLFEELDGEPTLIASYTCTPLVTIPAGEISDGNHIKAKTIAELGFGNAPIDMVSFMAQEQDGSFDKKLLVVHKNRGGTLISFKDLAKANQGEGMKGFSMGPEGVDIFHVSTGNTMHIDNQNQMMLANLKRNMDNGGVDLVSKLKGSYLRLSDFIAEYNFPDYEYSESQMQTKKFHDMIKPMEGFPNLTSDKKGK